MKAVLRSTASFAVLAALAGASAAHAEEASPGGSTVGELVVTAQKREQRLQEVPIVVTTVSERTLEGAGVRDVKDLQILTPGLIVTSTSNETVTTARIRGIGTVGDNPGLESSVGVVVDGVYRPRNGVGFGDLGELERIEVLKGPQGTLFGKNTSAGVVNVITKAPTFDPSVEAEGTFGNFDNRGGSISLNGPLMEDKVAGRLYAAIRNRDGFYDIRTGAGPRTREDDADQDFWTVRGQLLFDGGMFSLRLTGDYTKRDEFCCAAVQVRTGPTAAIVDAFAPDEGVAVVADPFDRVAYANRDTDQHIVDKGVAAHANFDFGWGDLTSITALRGWHTVTGQDTDFTTADIWYRLGDGSNDVRFNQFSQELRLAGSTPMLDWLVGGFFADEDLTRNDSIFSGSAYEPFLSTLTINNIAGLAGRLGVTPPSTASGHLFFDQTNGAGLAFGQGFPAGNGYRDVYEQSSKTWALFTNNTLHLGDKVNFTFGLRYTEEDKELVSSYSGFAPQCAAMLASTATVAGALIARGVSPAIFAPGDPRGPALVSTAIGTACLAGANPLFNGLVTTQERDESEFTGTAKIDVRWTPDIMTYVSYARGYKAGGFNLDRAQSSNGLQSGGSGVVPVPDTSFPAEFVKSYEAGFKSTLANGRLLLNATYFHQKYSDFQLNTFLGTSFIVEAIPRVTSKGVDADVIWLSPVDGLAFQGGITYANTKYGNFTAADLANPTRFPSLSLLPGARVSFAPKWSLTGAVDYSRMVSDDFRVMFNLSGKHLSSYNTGSDLSPFKVQDSYLLVNGRVGFGSADEKWTVELWAMNLTDADYYQVVFNAPLQGSFIPVGVNTYSTTADSLTYDAFLGAPRTYGATVRVKF